MSDYKTIKLRSDTLSAWAARNPVLRNRELAYAVDAQGMIRFKRGDGVTAWNSLPWVTNVAAENPEYTNYFHNWYWANPINQRGLALYSGAGPTIDRWNASTNMQVQIISNGIRLTTVGGVGRLSQVIEHPYRITARRVTVSVDIISAATDRFAIYFAYGSNYGQSTSGAFIEEDNVGIKSFSLLVPGFADTEGNLALCLRAANAASSVGIRSIKMEIGNRSTLLADSIAETSEQENICRRFLIPLAENSRYRMSSYGLNTMDFLIPITNNMRAIPTIEDTSLLSIRTLNATPISGITISNISVIRKDPAILVRVTTEGNHGLTDGILYISGKTYLNAELSM